MTDTLEFVKSLWGNMGIPGMGGAGAGMPGMQGMNIPGMVMPTLSVEEINKKIADLKAVESWLNLNMGMLRSAIQALEVQAGTLSTLQTMGETFAASMNTGFQGAGAKGATAGNGHGGNGHGGTATAPDKEENTGQPSDKDESDAAMLTAPLVNAAAWWNLLQDQFNKAVSNAMTESAEAAASATSAAPKAAKPAAKEKPRAKPATAGSSRKGGKQAGKA